MSFTWKEAQELKEAGIKALNKAGHKSTIIGKRKITRKKFAKTDESKFRTVKGVGYTEWMDNKGKSIEPCEANPDLWEDDIHNTVD